uniref:DUF659 domain-containing protein n=1 Tax=Globodera rostochiensis TaxID=31243 RepID=A0A914I6T0_GLORO
MSLIINMFYSNTPCGQKVTCSKFFQLKQHDETAKHKQNRDRYQQEGSSISQQPFLTQESFDTEQPDPFVEDLCDALIGANIPFFKINNPSLKYFLSKYTNRTIPDESTLRKNYLKICYKTSIERIKRQIGNSFIWVSVDETTDPLGRYAANLLVGKLDVSGFHPPNLIAVKMLEKTNFETVSRFVNTGLRDFGVKEENVLLLVTDAARYMIKAGKALSVFYGNMTHVTCVCHALHRVCEEVFTKAPYRVKVFKEICPTLALPPQPVLTRWGTWMTAVEYYHKNFYSVKAVVDSFDPENAISIQKSQRAFNHPLIRQHLAYLQSNFSILAPSITKLEAQGLTLAQVLNILAEVKTSIAKAEGDNGRAIKAKLELVLANNPGFAKIIAIAEVLKGGEAMVEMAPDMMASMRYAPLVSFLRPGPNRCTTTRAATTSSSAAASSRRARHDEIAPLEHGRIRGQSKQVNGGEATDGPVQYQATDTARTVKM